MVRNFEKKSEGLYNFELLLSSLINPELSISLTTRSGILNDMKKSLDDARAQNIPKNLLSVKGSEKSTDPGSSSDKKSASGTEEIDQKVVLEEGIIEDNQRRKSGASVTLEYSYPDVDKGESEPIGITKLIEEDNIEEGLNDGVIFESVK